MSLRTCIECKQSISDKAAACPHCGAPAPKPAISAAQILLLVITAGTAFTCAMQDKPPLQTSDAAPATRTAQACTVQQFNISQFNPRITDPCRRSPCPQVHLPGVLRNNCPHPAGAQIKITAYDKAGNVLSSFDGWPASTHNIAPGSDYPFDMTGALDYHPKAARFSAVIIDSRRWSN